MIQPATLDRYAESPPPGTLAEVQAERRWLKGIRGKTGDRLAQAARRDPNAMIEAVMVDKAGRPLKQRKAHRRIQDILQMSYEAGLKQRALQKPARDELTNLFIEMPFRSGKTQQFVGFMLWLLGQDQNLTCAYIREAREDAQDIVGQIATMIHTNEAYKAIFPEVKLTVRDSTHIPGGKIKFTIEREQAGLPDPTFIAIGRNKAAEGKRWDVAALDDVETIQTAYSEKERKSGIGKYDDAWTSRLDPDYGVIIGIGHERHKEGLIAHIKKEPRMAVMRMPVMQDLNDYGTCNFPEMYSERFIDEQKRNMTKFLKYYMLEPEDPEEQRRKEAAIQKAIDRAEFEGHRTYEKFVPKTGQFVSVGVDFPVKKVRAGGKEADNLTMYAQTYDPATGDQINLGMRMQKGGWYEIIDFLVAVCRDFGLLLPGPRVLVVESVQAQDWALQAFNDPQRGIIKRHPEFRNLRIEPYATSQATKLYDIPAVMQGYYNDKEILPAGPLTDAYKAGLMAWTPGDHTHDLLMGRVCSDRGIEILRKKYAGFDMFKGDGREEKPVERQRADYEPGNGSGAGEISNIVTGVY